MRENTVVTTPEILLSLLLMGTSCVSQESSLMASQNVAYFTRVGLLRLISSSGFPLLLDHDFTSSQKRSNMPPKRARTHQQVELGRRVWVKCKTN